MDCRGIKNGFLSFINNIKNGYGWKNNLERESDIDMEKIRSCLSFSKNENGFLVFLKDKNVFFYPENSQEKVFIMYGKKGDSYIAMGDPVGDELYIEECITHFKKFCKKERKKCIFYEVDETFAEKYRENNMTLSKIGERGKVSLKDFNLSGGDNAKLRHVYNQFSKKEYTLKIIKKEELTEKLEELETISKEWLKNKNSSEKKFSQGSFSYEYIKNFDVAVIEKDKKIVAFANIYGTGKKECMTLDLMRHREEIENGVMEYFFISLILYAQKEGYESFSLGIVPLAGIEKEFLAPYKNIENFIYHHEKHFYNFEGLKLFKDKFRPEWKSVYIAYSKHLFFPLVLKNVISLTSGRIIKG